MRKIKFIQQNKTGIFPLPPTFQQLKEEVKTLFNIKTETWSYTYFDQANDQLCVENQDDYEQFLEMNQGIETVEAKIVSDEYEEQAGAIEQDEGNIREDQDILNKSVMQETHEQIRSKKFTMHSAIYKEQKQKALSEEDLKNLVLFENSQLEHTNQVKKQQNSDHPQTNSLKGVAKVFQEKQKQELLGANSDLQAQQSKNYRIISQNSNKLPGREKFDDSSQLRDSQNHNFAINHSRKITASLQSISVRQQSHYPSPSKDHNAAQIQPLSTLSEEQQQNPCIRTTINGEKDQRASLLAELQQIKTRLKQEQDQNRQLKRQLQEAERQRKDGERQLKYLGQREVRQCVFCGRGENVGSYYNAFSDLWECVSCHKKYKIELRTGL